MKCAHIFVSGLVQGVFYRANTLKKATELGLLGWVRNLPDARVEILAQGDEPSLNDLIDWCKLGPPSARVDSVDVKWTETQDGLTKFSVITD